MTLTQIPYPYPVQAISWERWIATLVGFNDFLRPNVPWQTGWRETAERLTQFAPDAPRPESYTDWRDWAAALKRAYPG